MTRTVALLALCTFFLVVSSQGISEGKEENAQKLFERKCSTCHSINKPKSKAKTKEQWKSTVMRMKSANMALISDEEATIIIDYVAEHYGK